jgi:hypothetical protein
MVDMKILRPRWGYSSPLSISKDLTRTKAVNLPSQQEDVRIKRIPLLDRINGTPTALSCTQDPFGNQDSGDGSSQRKTPFDGKIRKTNNPEGKHHSKGDQPIFKSLKKGNCQDV